MRPSAGFLKKLNDATGMTFTLPTEAQWEFAARGGNYAHGYKYSGSDNLDDVAWHYWNSSSTTRPAGQKQPNELGIYDMSGNVWEWVEDWLGNYPAEPQTDPNGSATGSSRVHRGGGVYMEYNQTAYRVSCRHYGGPGLRDPNLGFRLALVVLP